MGLYRFWAWFGGYAVILVRGAGLERLLNLASANGIYLWEIRRHRPDLMVACIGMRGFRALRPFLRRSRCRAEILRKRGLVFLWLRLRRRPGLFLGFLLFLLALGIATSFVWWVEIVGPKHLDPAVIHKELRGLGLYPGAWRGRIDKERIARELEVRTPLAAWIGVEIRGMVAVVRVVERAIPPPAPAAADIVAARDGLITRLVVYRGTPLVGEGQMVRRGQVLVSGWEVRIDKEGNPRRRSVAAEAFVEARVWDEASAAVPLSIWEAVPTGRRYTVVRLGLGRWRFSLGRGRPPFAWFRQRRTSFGLGRGRNTLPLVEITFDRYDEVRPILRRRSQAAAAAMAAREAEAALRRLLPRAADPVVNRTVRSEPGLVTVILTAETVQEIGAAERRGMEEEFGHGGGTRVHGGE